MRFVRNFLLITIIILCYNVSLADNNNTLGGNSGVAREVNQEITNENEKDTNLNHDSNKINKDGVANENTTNENIPDNIDLNNLILMELDNGGIVLIEMYPDKAPWHIYRIKLLVANNFYDGLSFFRAVKNFMVQTGDPTNSGNGGSKFGRIQAEINDLKHVRGTVSMARGQSIDSADSQFFIITAEKAPHLDGQYTIFGKVIYGMDYIDQINTSSMENDGFVKDPTKIVKMKLVQELNYSYEDDTEEQIEKRKQERLEILRNLNDLKEVNDALNMENRERVSLIDRIVEFNGSL